MTTRERNAKKVYQEQQQYENTEDMIVKYLPLIRKLARKLSMALPPSLDEEDLIGSGIIGLLEAWERFEPSRGVQFSTYATWRIKGSMIDEIRKTSLAPRSLFSQVRQVHEAEEQLRQSLNREPEREELAANLGWPVATLEQVWANYNLLTVVSFEKVISYEDGDETLKLEGVLSSPEEYRPDEVLAEKEKIELLTLAIEQLSERDRMILALFYYEELTKKEIAQVMKISAARVSQLHSRAVERLRAFFAEPGE